MRQSTEESDFIFFNRSAMNHIEIMNNDPSVGVDDSALEKEIQDTLNGCDVQQQIRASISSGPGGAEMLPGIRIPRKRSLLFSKIPLSCFNNVRQNECYSFFTNSFFRKLKKPNEPDTRRSKPFEIYKFADKLDIFLMIIGTSAG